MADEIDQMKEREGVFEAKIVGDIQRAEAIRAATPSATHCWDCGDPIPEERRRYAQGCKYCISCQEAIENEM